MNNKFINFLTPVFQLFLILAVGSVIIISTVLLVNKIKQPEVEITEKVVEIEKIIKAPDCGENFNDYKELVDKGQFIVLVKNRNMYGSSSGQFVNSVSINVNRSGDGIIACGYLYIKANIDGETLNDEYESIYINPNSFGGYILSSKSFEIENQESNKTSILLPLNAISYLPSLPYNPDAQNYKIANWVNLLNIGNKVNFAIGLSSLNPNSYIEEIIIAYKCWDSNTGKETQNCQLSL